MKSLLTHIYNSGYKAGHHDTVEGYYTDIFACDMDSYHLDIVEELYHELLLKHDNQKDLLILLKAIEWKGASDYSIGVRTCPYCGRRGNVSKQSQWYQGHSENCSLNNMIQELECL